MKATTVEGSLCGSLETVKIWWGNFFARFRQLQHSNLMIANGGPDGWLPAKMMFVEIVSVELIVTL